MTHSICPHLGAVDAGEKRCDAVTYPSFENRCFVAHLVNPAADELDSREQLLFREQATFCLGQGYRLCPRFRLFPTVAVDAGSPAPDLEQMIAPVLSEAGFVYEEAEPERSLLPLWAAMASMLLVLLLCGGSVAAYAGWQLVGRGIVTLAQRADESQADQNETGQVIVLVTATSAPAVPGPGVIVQADQPTPTPTFNFPQAVTATPASQEMIGPVVITTPTPTGQPGDPLAPELATAVAGSLIITQPGDTPATPTRRPTPAFVVPTSTPGTPLVVDPFATPTPTPVLLEAKISFRSAHQSLLPGTCTILYWDVENVRAVFLDGMGVAGKGEREVCLRFVSQSFTLSVLKADGVQESRTVIVEIVPHTPTPTITPTNTPVLTPTPTWTPEGPPAATPVPPNFGVRVVVDGGNQKECTPGQTCEVMLLVENTGSLADEMFVNLGKSSPWTTSICRDDGACADTALSVGVGPGTWRAVLLRAQVPGDATGQSYTFQVEALSGNSGRTVSSGQVPVTLRTR